MGTLQYPSKCRDISVLFQQGSGYTPLLTVSCQHNQRYLLSDMGKTCKQEEYYRLVEAVFQANGKLLATGDHLSMEFDLTGARWQVLGALQLENRPLTVAQIARRMGLQRQSVQRLVDIMVKQGVLTTLPNPEHKRAKLIDFTVKGMKVRDQLIAVHGHWTETLLQEFSEEELQLATRVLRKLLDKLDPDA